MAEIHRIAILSEALILLGEEPIDQLEGVGVAKALARARFGPVANLLLALHPWDFSKRVEPLVRLAAAIPAGVRFDAGYQMPAHVRFTVPLIDDEPVDDWQIAERTLYLDAGLNDVVSAEFHAPVDESLWPPAFREAVVYRLAGEFCLPIREDSRGQSVWMQLAGQHLAIAKHQHAVQAPRPTIKTGRFQALRHR